MVHWYKRDPDAALNGMVELSLVDRGAYNSVLDLLYARDGDVPDDDVLVARMIRCHWREWKAAKSRLISAGKIWAQDGKLCAKRVSETLKEAAELSQEQRKRAAQRWQKEKNVKENNETPMPPGNASTTTTTKKKERRLEDSDSVYGREGTRQTSEFDFVSTDGVVVFIASEIDELQTELPAIDVRAQIRRACRDWAADIPPRYRKASVIKGLRTTHRKKSSQSNSNGNAASPRKTIGEFGRLSLQDRMMNGKFN